MPGWEEMTGGGVATWYRREVAIGSLIVCADLWHLEENEWAWCLDRSKTERIMARNVEKAQESVDYIVGRYLRVAAKGLRK